MRFLENGPAIPDQLLNQCDKGRVVFLCGAGVSMPAGMPSFAKLTKYVVDYFDPSPDSPVRLKEGSWSDSDQSGLSVPLDQIFQILYQEYGRSEVNAVVAKCLFEHGDSSKPKQSHEHNLIARVSSDPEGRPQIITTNFDQLFETCSGMSADRTFEPPAFPNIELGMSLHGLTYLHGRLQPLESNNHDYVLSSSGFGRAYLAEGWATRFIKSLLANYTVVLVGYSANDPPVEYLLQGLNHDGSVDHSNLYAFEAGDLEDIEVKWRDRGVTPIPYSTHEDLWKTLGAWAERADNPREWRNGIVEMAKKGPRMLAPHERGQVAHVVRTAAGAKAFLRAKPSPPAEWLCVFDATCRAAKKPRQIRIDGTAEEFDPLLTYCLDDDPERPDQSENELAHSFDQLLEWRRGDTNPTDSHRLVGIAPKGFEKLPPRLNHLLFWSTDHINDPVFAWWATQKSKLHPKHAELIERKLLSLKEVHPIARQFWTLFLESMHDMPKSGFQSDYYDLQKMIEKVGWTSSTLRYFESNMGPFLQGNSPYSVAAAKPPEGDWNDVSMFDIVNWEVRFKNRHGQLLEVPEEALLDVFKIAEGHLKRAGGLYSDTGTNYLSTPTCYPGREVDGEDVGDDQDAYFQWFLVLIQEMSEKHPRALRHHASNWNHRDRYFFRKLKLFVLNDPHVFDAVEAGSALIEFSQDALWDHEVRRELLFLIADRWSEFTAEHRFALTARLLAGPEHEGYLSDDIRDRYAAMYVRWIEIQGHSLPEDHSSQLRELIARIPDWRDEWAESIATEHGLHSGPTNVDTEPRHLENAPIGQVVDLALSENATIFGTHGPVRIDRFRGLVLNKPQKALAALTLSAREGDYPIRLWQTLIQVWPEDVSPRLSRVFLHRISRLPREKILELDHALTDRINRDFASAHGRDPQLAWLVFDAVLAAFASEDGAFSESPLGDTYIKGEVTRSSRRTFEHAINGPVGKMVRGWMSALIDYLHTAEAQGMPEEFKVRRVNLLASSGEGRDHAVAIFTYQAHWLNSLDPEWVQNEMMSWFDFDHPFAEPAWNGLLSSRKIPPKEIGELLNSKLVGIFPMIDQWNWSDELGKVAAGMVVLLNVFRKDHVDGLSNREARQCIRNMTDKSRSSAVLQLKKIALKHDNGWQEHILPFIENVWPRERKFRTTKMVTNWMVLLESSDDDFPLLLRCVHKFLVPVKLEHGLYGFCGEVSGEEALTIKHPEAVLDMLDAIVPSDPRSAPELLDSILSQIEESDPSLIRDHRFFRLIELAENI